MLEEITLLLFFLSLLFPTAFNIVFQLCMVKLLRSAGWNVAATEFSILNKEVLVVFFKREFICSCIVCSCEGATMQ